MIGLPGRGGCGQHRAALIDFAARRATGPGVRQALDHVDRCRSCEGELATTTLVLHGLRRLHEDTERAEPEVDGWTRLRARLATTRREQSRLLSGLPGIVAAAAVCAVLVGPAALVGGGPTQVYNEAPRGAASPSLQFEKSRERARQAGLLPERAAARPYTGVRIAPPPISADLPPSTGRQTAWIDDIVETRSLAPASATRADSAQRQAGRR
ncbi:MAG: hypothetical protein ABIG85_06810 [Chloroflexota bacterium]